MDYVRYIPLASRPVVTLLLFPPVSHTPSGFYKIEPNGVGGNKITLVHRVAVDPRTEKAWFTSASERARLVADMLDNPDSSVSKMIASGEAHWSPTPAEMLVAAVMADPDARA